MAAAALTAAGQTPAAAAAVLRWLRTQWRAVTRRDFFPPPQREQARSAMQELADRVATATEVTP